MGAMKSDTRDGIKKLEDVFLSEASKIIKEIEDAEAVVFVTADGLPVAFESRFNPNVVDRISALSAMLFSVGKRVAHISSLGNPEYTEHAMERGKLFIFPVNGEIFLTILTSAETNVGLVRLLARNTISKVKEEMERKL